ncbi:MAG: hypothetical protein M1372_02820 [Patescibacteria group bacterium]|nr:hypothetical protein [Patescibacteria group bacterium]
MTKLERFKAMVNEQWSDSVLHARRRQLAVDTTWFKLERIALRHEIIESGKPAAVVIGSFRFKDKLDEATEEFEQNGFTVLMPPKGKVTARSGEFPILDVDGENPNPIFIENTFILAAQIADVVYVVNPGGYVGDMSTLEIGLSMTVGVPIYSRERIRTDLMAKDIVWRDYCNLIKPFSVEQVATMVKAASLDAEGYPWYRPWNATRVYRPAPDLEFMPN